MVETADDQLPVRSQHRRGKEGSGGGSLGRKTPDFRTGLQVYCIHVRPSGNIGIGLRQQ